MDAIKLTFEEYQRELAKIRVRCRDKIETGTMTKDDWLTMAADYEAIGAVMNAHNCKRHAGIFEPVYSPFVEMSHVS